MASPYKIKIIKHTIVELCQESRPLTNTPTNLLGEQTPESSSNLRNNLSIFRDVRLSNSEHQILNGSTVHVPMVAENFFTYHLHYGKAFQSESRRTDDSYFPLWCLPLPSSLLRLHCTFTHELHHNIVWRFSPKRIDSDETKPDEPTRIRHCPPKLVDGTEDLALTNRDRPINRKVGRRTRTYQSPWSGV